MADDEMIPPAEFTPSGDGSYRVRCCVCREIVPSDQAHVVKSNHGSGRANRCEDCGQRIHAQIVRFNRDLIARTRARAAAVRSGTDS